MTKVLHLQPIRLIHTSTQYDVDMGHPVSTSFLHILVLIALLIQVIACINFMNLSTAKASGRAKEVVAGSYPPFAGGLSVCPVHPTH